MPSSVIYFCSMSWVSSKIREEQISYFIKKYPFLLEASLIQRELKEIFNLDIPLQSLEQVQKFWESEKSKELSYISYLDEAYPRSFLSLNKKPILLSYLGTLDCLQSFKLSVVGSRNILESTKEWMDYYLSAFIDQKNMCLISGAARGVDQFAHNIAIKKMVATCAVIPSGLFQIYPKNFKQFQANILKDGGLIFSEYAPWELMRTYFFHERNRLIACLADILLVAQAARASGSMITAKIAMDIGKDIAVIPCSPCSKFSSGGLDLLMDGAAMVRDDRDLESLKSLIPNFSQTIKAKK